MTDLETKPPRVLVVDDHRDTAVTLGLMLGAAGYQVETTFDGVSALAAAERFAPDACVLDIDLPGMDGYELAKRLRAQGAKHPLVLATVTGHNDDQHLDRAVEAGFDLHFSKPIDPLDLAEQLRGSLDGGNK